MSFQFAHISDLHLPPLPAVALHEIANKRALGYLSWHRKRKHRHGPEAVAALRSMLAERRVDHICVTGDITNLGLTREFRSADRWLASLTEPDTATFVPGNHDAYVVASVAAMQAHFDRWLPDVFPCITRRDGVTFIGVSSAVATAPFMATGRVGRRQLEDLVAVLDDTQGEDALRVMMIHHPPLQGIVGRRKELTDAAALQSVLQRRPVDLIIHGHGHRPVRYELDTDRGPIPVFGAGSASLSHADTARTGHFHLFELNGRDIRVTHHHYHPGRGAFEPTGELRVPRRLASR